MLNASFVDHDPFRTTLLVPFNDLGHREAERDVIPG
jgi:hypothetical protein